MKNLSILTLVLASGSVFAGEISETQCMVQYEATSNMLILDNEIEPMQLAYEANCLDLAKTLAKVEIQGKTISGIKLLYKNPGK